MLNALTIMWENLRWGNLATSQVFCRLPPRKTKQAARFNKTFGPWLE